MIEVEFISKLSKTKQKKSLQPLNNKSHPFSVCLLFTITIALILPLSSSHAAEVTLTWDYNDQALGYILYYGLQSRTYENMIDVGNNLKITVTNLSENQIYYFAVTAYNEYEESDFSAEISYFVPLFSEDVPPFSEDPNFENYVIKSYSGSQDQNPIVRIENNGATLHITGNGWKKVYFPYALTPNSVLEFDFKSSVEGEIHGIGFDDDDTIGNPIQTFQLYGTQSWFWVIPDFNNYQNTAPNWKHYRIPIGQFYTGEMLYLTFANDHDAAPQDADSFFSNVRVFEDQ